MCSRQERVSVGQVQRGPPGRAECARRRCGPTTTRSGGFPEPGTLDALLGPFDMGLPLPACVDRVHLASRSDLPCLSQPCMIHCGPPAKSPPLVPCWASIPPSPPKGGANIPVCLAALTLALKP